MSITDIQAVRFEDIISGIGDISLLGDDELARLCEVKEELEARERDYGILYYKAFPHQELFHKSQKKVRMIGGGNQSGKSLCSTVEGMQLSLGIHPYRKMSIPNKGRVVANDIKKGLGEIISTLYSKFLPMSEVKRIKKYPGGEISKVEYRNGSQVDFLTYEQDTKAFEGWTGNWVQWDEPMPREKYIASLRGLIRYKGITWMAMTPLKSRGYMTRYTRKPGLVLTGPMCLISI